VHHGGSARGAGGHHLLVGVLCYSHGLVGVGIHCVLLRGLARHSSGVHHLLARPGGALLLLLGWRALHVCCRASWVSDHLLNRRLLLLHRHLLHLGGGCLLHVDGLLLLLLGLCLLLRRQLLLLHVGSTRRWLRRVHHHLWLRRARQLLPRWRALYVVHLCIWWDAGWWGPLHIVHLLRLGWQPLGFWRRPLCIHHPRGWGPTCHNSTRRQGQGLALLQAWVAGITPGLCRVPAGAPGATLTPWRTLCVRWRAVVPCPGVAAWRGSHVHVWRGAVVRGRGCVGWQGVLVDQLAACHVAADSHQRDVCGQQDSVAGATHFQHLCARHTCTSMHSQMQRKESDIYIPQCPTHTCTTALHHRTVDL
jgi:hypothetical protein